MPLDLTVTTDRSWVINTVIRKCVLLLYSYSKAKILFASSDSLERRRRTMAKRP
jgi:hypothetical protein